MRKRLLIICVYLLGITPSLSFAQPADSVDVTFFHIPEGNPGVVYLPGEFNGWQLNSKTAMTKDPQTGVWHKTIRLRVGGPSPLPVPGKSIPGAYQYKFNEDKVHWLQDPRNPRQNPKDHDNSYLFITNPTIHYLLPNSTSGVVKTRRPEITAYLFPAVSSQVDVNSITLTIDGTTYHPPAQAYDAATHQFSFQLPQPLANGEHQLKLVVNSDKGTTGTDSVQFITQAGLIQLLTLSNDHYLRPTKEIAGTVEDSTINSVTMVHNGQEIVVPVSNRSFIYTAHLLEGENRFWAYFTTNRDARAQSDSIIINYVVNHTPRPEIQVMRQGDKISFSAIANDPDGETPAYRWQSEDAKNPAPLQIDASGANLSVPIPTAPGMYYIRLMATDAEGHRGVARSYFSVAPDGEVTLASTNSNPPWVRDAIIYEIFLPAFTREGTFRAAMANLSRIKALGANVIWLMPIYDNGETINTLNAGYNIVDFFKVHPQLGTLEDFQAFLQEAHRLGLRVILDNTPNHVSAAHPWVKDIARFQDFSNYRPFIENKILGNDRGLGQFITTSNGYPLYAHYSNWSLANLNYSNIETREAMLNMYKFWVLEQGVDGFRMDVFWGPQNRYGKDAWWRPFREEMKRGQPDVFILGETDATGTGSENNFAEGGSACDAAYDWNFYNQVKNVLQGGRVDELDRRVRNFSPNLNYNHFTGAHSHYFRFLENHDETRFARLFPQEKTLAAATLLLTAPGIPLIYAGQEVGEVNKRELINWQRPGAQSIFSFYQKLITIRNRFATFRSPKIKRILSSSNRVYAYLRPQLDQNAIAAINFSGQPVNAMLFLSEADLQLSSDSLQSGKSYYLNDVLNDTFYVVTRASLGNVQLKLPAWGASVFLFADSMMSKITGIGTHSNALLPIDLALYPNYPNPFNPETTITYKIQQAEKVRVEIMDLLGRQVAVLVDEFMPAGQHIVKWNGKNDRGTWMHSGIYVVRLRVPGKVMSRKITLLK